MTTTIFNESRVSNNILNKDGEVYYYGKILSSEETNQCLDSLMQNIQWEKDKSSFLVNILLRKEKLHGMVILNTCILI
ncbi:MAG: hypothetical protein ACJ72T_06915 [Nitrososphaeraceae archaeon]